MSHPHIPNKYWDEIIASVTYLLNILPSHSKSIPFSMLFNKTPDYSILKILGCLCFPLTRPYNKNKLELRSLPCVFIGYALSQKGYRCLHIPSNKIYTSRHVIFDEDTFPFASQFVSQLDTQQDRSIMSILPLVSTCPNSSPIPEATAAAPAITATSSSPPLTPIPPQPMSPPPTVQQPVTHHMTTRAKDNTRKTKTFPNHITFLTTTDGEPTSHTKASLSPEWRHAMALEIDALAQNKTWKLVPPPANQTVIGCKWVYKNKRKSDGRIDRHKARLGAKGFSQIEGVDVFDTYSPVVRPATIRLLLSVAVSSGWSIQQLDVQNAFLHGELSEKVYMQQPPGFLDSQHHDYVCLLDKALYGLKQAPRAWFQKLSSTLIGFGFKESQYDPSLFYCHSEGHSLFILIYVDDILITGSSRHHITSCINKLQSNIRIKDMGPVHFFLGIEVKTGKEGLHLNQTKYIENLVQHQWQHISLLHPMTASCVMIPICIEVL